MTTFSAYGMGPKGYLVDRPLDDHERTYKLDTKVSASDAVLCDAALIKLNSTFVECVDPWYSMRGTLALFGTGFAAASALGLALGLYAWIDSRYGGFLLLVAWSLATLWLPIKFFLSDAFTYTHYPIRFNRQSRQLYVFRRDGTVLKVGWDELFWTIYNTKLGLGGGDLIVMGHVLGKDGTTVKESLGLSWVDAGESGLNNLRQFFEFFRRYMEDGPEAVIKALRGRPLILLPRLDQEKETWFFGWRRITGNWNGAPVMQALFQVFFLPISIFRWLVMRTSKIPRWPQWVEDECRMGSNDPLETRRSGMTGTVR